MASSKFTPWVKGCIRGLVCQAPWTKCRAVERGYILPDVLCPLRLGTGHGVPSALDESEAAVS
eukprot:7967551-Pyramimonas_sp.AAC.1